MNELPVFRKYDLFLSLDFWNQDFSFSQKHFVLVEWRKFEKDNIHDLGRNICDLIFNEWKYS